MGFGSTPELRAAVELSVDKSSCLEVVGQGGKPLQLWVSASPVFSLLTPARPHTGRCRSVRSAGVRQATVRWPRAPGSCLILRGLSEAQRQVPTRAPLGSLVLPSFKNNLSYSFVAVLGLHCCTGLLSLQGVGVRSSVSRCGPWGYTLVGVFRLSCSTAGEILPDPGLNLCLLRWQDSSPLSHLGSPDFTFLRSLCAVLQSGC